MRKRNVYYCDACKVGRGPTFFEFFQFDRGIRSVEVQERIERRGVKRSPIALLASLLLDRYIRCVRDSNFDLKELLIQGEPLKGY